MNKEIWRKSVRFVKRNHGTEAMRNITKTGVCARIGSMEFASVLPQA
jgi:hypothetical protein